MSENFGEGQIYVDYNGLEQVKEDLLAHTRAIQTLLNNLDQELAPLKASWSGDDQYTYQMKQQQWNQALENMATGLTAHSNLLGDIRDSYAHHERNLAQLWSEVRV